MKDYVRDKKRYDIITRCDDICAYNDKALLECAIQTFL